MNNNLYIGGISYNTTDEALKNYFAEKGGTEGQPGNVTSAQIMMDRYTGRSRGFGFVEFATEEEAKRALEATNGKEFDGRTLTVDFARPKTDRPDRPERSSNHGGFNRQ